MISKINRFHGRKALDFVYRKGRTARTEFISLRYAPSRRENYRLAVVVSRKVSKSAVVRNRIRRRIYETVRLQLKAPLKQDLVINVYDERVAAMAPKELEKTIGDLLQKAAR